MPNVSQILYAKGYKVHTVESTDTVFNAIAKMVSNNVGSLVVLENGEPCGIITERDYLRRVALEGRASRTTFVKEIMSSQLVYVDPDADLEECMLLMTRRRVRHLPVCSDGHLIGILSMGDIVKHMARENKTQVEELTAYIQGAHYY